MCTVSMIGDHYRDKWRDYDTYVWPQVVTTTNLPEIGRIEFDALKKEVLEMKSLLQRAKEYDAKNGEPDCEMENKMKFLKRVASAVGVDLDDILGSSSHSVNSV